MKPKNITENELLNLLEWIKDNEIESDYFFDCNSYMWYDPSKDKTYSSIELYNIYLKTLE